MTFALRIPLSAGPTPSPPPHPPARTDINSTETAKNCDLVHTVAHPILSLRPRGMDMSSAGIVHTKWVSFLHGMNKRPSDVRVRRENHRHLPGRGTLIKPVLPVLVTLRRASTARNGLLAGMPRQFWQKHSGLRPHLTGAALAVPAWQRVNVGRGRALASLYPLASTTFASPAGRVNTRPWGSCRRLTPWAACASFQLPGARMVSVVFS